MTTEETYPNYSCKRGKNGKCRWKGNDVVVEVKSFQYAVPQCQRGNCQGTDEGKLAAAVAAHGPLSICVNSGDGQSGDWQRYKGGVLKGECNAKANKIDHCVQLVG